MPPLVLRDALVLVNSVDLSDFVRKVTVNAKDDDVDLTTMGATNKVHGKGLGDATMSVEFLQSTALGEVDATLWPLKASSSTFPLEVRSTSAGRSTTNPGWFMNALLMDYSPLDGAVGDASATTVPFVNGSQTGLQRLTS